MNGASMVVLGAREVQQAFESLEPKLQKKALRTVFRQLAKIAAAETRQTVPVRTGVIKKSVRVRSIKRSRTRTGVAVLAGTKGRGPGFYAVMVEKGTKARKTKRGKSTGRVVGRWFMKQAFENKADEMLEVGLRSLKDHVEALAEEGRK